MLVETSNISKHISRDLLTILPKLATASHGSSSDALRKIDLSLAENLILRDELLVFCKDAIAHELRAEVGQGRK